MDLPHLKSYLKSSNLRVILQSKELAQLGDFLANFIYSTVRVGIKGNVHSVHVWDVSLKNAMDKSGLRTVLGQRTKPDRVADAAEALIAYTYYNNVLTLDEMIDTISTSFGDNKLTTRPDEKIRCADAFSDLLSHIYTILIERELITPIQLP